MRKRSTLSAAKRSFVIALAATSFLATPAYARHHHDAPLTPEQVAETEFSRDVILDKQVEFDDNGIMLPPAPMTRTEAIMTAQIEQHCEQLARERIKGKAGDLIKKSALGGIISAVFGGLGSLFFPFAHIGQYAGYAGAAGAGSGAFTSTISVSQARSVVNSYCQIMQINNLRTTGDRRVRMIIAIPAINLKGTRLPVDWNTRVETRDSIPVSAADALETTPPPLP